VAILMARTLVERGHAVSVVSRFPGPLLGEFEQAAPTFVEPLHRVRRRSRRVSVTARVGRVADVGVALATMVRHRPDVVYVNSTAAAVYLRPARWLRRRVILHVHESEAVAGQFLSSVWSPPGLAGIELVACSPSVRRDLARLTARPEAEILMIPSVPDGPDVERRATHAPAVVLQPDEIVVGCCGAVEARKGADLWVEAARRVLAERPDRRLRFVWVGDVAEPIAVRAGEPITFVGPSDNPYALMRRFDIATLPSRDDPFPLVVLEAMLLGVPIVAFAVGGVPQQVGDTGILVPPGDVPGFADALIRLIDDPVERARLSAAARERAESVFSVRAFAASIVELVEGHPSGSASLMPGLEQRT